MGKDIVDRMMSGRGVPAAQRRMAETVGTSVIKDILNDNRNGSPVGLRGGFGPKEEVRPPAGAGPYSRHIPLPVAPPGMAHVDRLAAAQAFEDKLAKAKEMIAAGRGEEVMAQLRREAEAEKARRRVG
jgi:hypothetical protein